MKKFLLGLILGLVGTANAGLITHTDYTAGNVITAAGQNSNENTIVNEINGNLDSANIEDGGIATADLADNAVTQAKLATNITSTFTVIQQMASYRRPVLQWISATTIDVENNSATQHETCIIFPGAERRCVTENTGSTNQYRRWDITAACNFRTGTEESGLSGATEATNTWYGLYAVKSLVDSSKFVICGSTRTPTQGNVTSLNTMYETNGWYYLGMVRNGSDGDNTGNLLDFDMAGNRVLLSNTNNGGSGGIATPGIRLADTGGATSLSWTYAAGSGNAEVPGHFTHILYTAELAAVASTHIVDDPTGARAYVTQTSNSNTQMFREWIQTGESVRLRAGNGGSIAMNLIVSGWIDGVLGVSFNPQI